MLLQDKNLGSDRVAQAAAFREVVQAYEILSNRKSRDEYDEQLREYSNLRGGFQPYFFQHAEHFENLQSNHFGLNREPTNYRTGYWNADETQHLTLFDPALRELVFNAQMGVLLINSLLHLRSVTADDSGKSEQHTIIAFYDSSVPSCEETLNLIVLYPWPFAGFDELDSVLWDELVTPVKVDVNGSSPKCDEVGQCSLEAANGLRELAGHFQVELIEGVVANCPSFAFIPKNGERYLLSVAV